MKDKRKEKNEKEREEKNEKITTTSEIKKKE